MNPSYSELLHVHNACLDYHDRSGCDIRCPYSRFTDLADWHKAGGSVTGCMCVYGDGKFERNEPKDWVLPDL